MRHVYISCWNHQVKRPNQLTYICLRTPNIAITASIHGKPKAKQSLWHVIRFARNIERPTLPAYASFRTSSLEAIYAAQQSSPLFLRPNQINLFRRRSGGLTINCVASLLAAYAVVRLTRNWFYWFEVSVCAPSWFAPG